MSYIGNLLEGFRKEYRQALPAIKAANKNGGLFSPEGTKAVLKVSDYTRKLLNSNNRYKAKGYALDPGSKAIPYINDKAYSPFNLTKRIVRP